MEGRNIYLTNIPLSEAKDMYFSRLKKEMLFDKKEFVPVMEALNRITVYPIFAKKSSPCYNAAAMDGIAVVSKNTYGASESNPLSLEKEKDYIMINTGGHIYEPYDAVVMIEDVVELEEDKIQIMEAARPWQHVRPIGEDIVEGELILPARHEIRPVDIGALLAGQIKEVEVYKMPSVGILPTGSEIVDVSQPLEAGKIIDSNSSMFAAMVKEHNGIPKVYSVVKDQYHLIKENVLKGVKENDILIINAGSSAGTKDYTVSVLREIGEVIIHGVATKPGKPVILAIVNNKPVIGIPGYPVSAYFTMEFFVIPLLEIYNHSKVTSPATVKATLSRRVVSTLKYQEYVRVKLGAVNDKIIATPLERGAGVTMSLVRADGVLIIPQSLEGYEGGTEIEVQLMKPLEEIKNTIVSIGSHDLVMDLLANQVQKTHGELFLSSAHVGSLGGIMAMKKKECHISPIHLFDAETGEYNRSYIHTYIKNGKLALIKFVRRSQGLMVKKGNPKRIVGFKDLIRNDIVFVNRQRGAGTRILFDYYIKMEHISAHDIIGYEREMTTHMGVAAAIAGGTADCGMGVYSAAKTMGLDFIPIAWEDYDLLIDQEQLEEKNIQLMIGSMKSEEFIAIVNGLGGYNTDGIGEVIIL